MPILFYAFTTHFREGNSLLRQDSADPVAGRKSIHDQLKLSCPPTPEGYPARE